MLHRIASTTLILTNPFSLLLQLYGLKVLYLLLAQHQNMKDMFMRTGITALTAIFVSICTRRMSTEVYS